MNKFYESGFLLSAAVFVITALLMAVYQAVEYFIFGAMNLRVLHTIIIFSSSAITASFSVLIFRWLKYYSEIKATEVRQETYEAAMRATSHYVGNILNIFQICEVESNSSGAVSYDSVREISEALRLIDRRFRGLRSLDNPTKENIEQYVKANL